LSELWIRYTPLIWYEQEDLRHKAHLESLPLEQSFYLSSRPMFYHKDTLVGLQVDIPVHKIHKLSSLKFKEFT